MPNPGNPIEKPIKARFKRRAYKKSPKVHRARCLVCGKTVECFGYHCPECYELVQRLTDLHAEDGSNHRHDPLLTPEAKADRDRRVDELARRYEMGVPLFPSPRPGVVADMVKECDKVSQDSSARKEVVTDVRSNDQATGGGCQDSDGQVSDGGPRVAGNDLLVGARVSHGPEVCPKPTDRNGAGERDGRGEGGGDPPTQQDEDDRDGEGPPA